MMRERLVELIKQGDKAFADKYTGKVVSHIEEVYDFVADYLLANGVVVLPCKVGDVIYETDGIRIYESIIRKVIYETKGIAFDESAIGKSVFLSRDDAERALKGVTDKFVGGKDKGGEG